jgi:hypothetical protein
MNRRIIEISKHDLFNIRGIRCHLCGGKFGKTKFHSPTKDHIIPRTDSSNPKSDLNLNWAHDYCNHERSNMPLVYYRMLQMFTGKIYPTFYFRTKIDRRIKLRLKRRLKKEKSKHDSKAQAIVE